MEKTKFRGVERWTCPPQSCRCLCDDPTLHDSGEILLAALGELHLERCLKICGKNLAALILMSKPLVMFRETLVYDAVHLSNGKAYKKVLTHGIETIPDKSITITVTQDLYLNT